MPFFYPFSVSILPRFADWYKNERGVIHTGPLSDKEKHIARLSYILA
jgi:hypothetical protein